MGLNGVHDPSPAEMAEIEQRKRELREENARKLLGMRNGAFKDAQDVPATVKPKPASCWECGAETGSGEYHASGCSKSKPNYQSPQAIPAAQESLGSCPDCGTPYGKRKRCYVCSPAIPAGTVKPKVEPAPTAKTSPQPLFRAAPIAPPEPRETGVLLPKPPAPAVPALDALRSLRSLSDSLAALPDDEAKWFLDTLYDLSRAQRAKS